MRFRYTLLIFFCAALMLGFTLGELAEKKVVDEALARHHALQDQPVTVPTDDAATTQAVLGC